MRLPGFISFLLIIPIQSITQENYEIQVYASPTMTKGNTIFELHSNFTFAGEKNIIDGVRPSWHSLHETLYYRDGADGSHTFVFATKHRPCAMTGTLPFKDSATRIARKMANLPSLEREGMQACYQGTEMSVLFLMLGIAAEILGMIGWGGRDRTSEWRNQNPLPYRLATPQQRGRTLRSPRNWSE